MLNIFFFLFYPDIYLVDWHSHILESVIVSFGIVLLSIFVYGIFRYRRETESIKFWTVFGGAMLIAFCYIFYKSTTISIDICRGNYKLLYVLNFMISSLLLEVGLFYAASNILGSKKYFARVHEYFRKGSKEFK